MIATFANTEVEHETFAELVGTTITLVPHGTEALIVAADDDRRTVQVLMSVSHTLSTFSWDDLTTIHHVAVPTPLTVRTAESLAFLATNNKDLRDRAFAAEAATEKLKETVKTVAVQKAQEFGWCSQVAEALRGMGIDPTITKTYRVVLEVSLAVDLGYDIASSNLKEAINNGDYYISDYDEMNERDY